MAPEWQLEVLLSGVNPQQPGLYEWRIVGIGCYIGQYTSVSRPRRAYALNVERLIAGHAYRKNKPDRFRLIHHKLAEGIRGGASVTLILLENQADRLDRTLRERELIAIRRLEAALGGLPVLNGT